MADNNIIREIANVNVKPERNWHGCFTAGPGKRSVLERFSERVSAPDANGCWLWRGKPTTRGYGSMQTDGVNCQAHRLSWILNVGPIPDGMCVLHKCDVRLCVNPDHLFLGTNADNVADKVRKGRQSRISLPGELHPMAKLTNAQRDSVVVDKRPGKVVAAEFGISVGHVWSLRYKARKDGRIP